MAQYKISGITTRYYVDGVEVSPTTWTGYWYDIYLCIQATGVVGVMPWKVFYQKSDQTTDEGWTFVKQHVDSFNFTIQPHGEYVYPAQVSDMHGLPDPSAITPGNEWSVYSDEQTITPEKGGATLVFHVYCHTTVPTTQVPFTVDLGSYVTKDRLNPRTITGLSPEEDYFPNDLGLYQTGRLTNFDGGRSFDLRPGYPRSDTWMIDVPRNMTFYASDGVGPAGCYLTQAWLNWNGNQASMAIPGNNTLRNMSQRSHYLQVWYVFVDYGFQYMFAATLDEQLPGYTSVPTIKWSDISSDYEYNPPYINHPQAEIVYDTRIGSGNKSAYVSWMPQSASKYTSQYFKNTNPERRITTRITYGGISSVVEFSHMSHTYDSLLSVDFPAKGRISSYYDSNEKTGEYSVISGWGNGQSTSTGPTTPPEYEGEALVYKRVDFNLSTSLNYPYGGRVFDNSISGKHKSSFWWNNGQSFEDGASVSCIPNEGYTFCYWKDNHGNTYDQQNFSFLLSDDTSLTAYISCEGLLYSVENDHLIHGTHNFNNGLLYADELLEAGL